jgi:hypothetical protein
LVRKEKDMTKKRAAAKQRYYTVAEANATLPLVRRIVEDLSSLAHDLRDRHQRLARLTAPNRGKMSAAHAEEVERVQQDLERDGDRLQEYVDELRGLGVELKDYFMGLIDFRSRMDGREVYLCWKLGEPYVAHWHELDAGFAGRRRLAPDASTVQG